MLALPIIWLAGVCFIIFMYEFFGRPGKKPGLFLPIVCLIVIFWSTVNIGVYFHKQGIEKGVERENRRWKEEVVERGVAEWEKTNTDKIVWKEVTKDESN